MRKWEKTFPDELLGTVWATHEMERRDPFSAEILGKLVMEFIYEYLDSQMSPIGYANTRRKPTYAGIAFING